MITFSVFKESVIEAGKRILKVNQFGAKTAIESMPFGFDSNPLKDMIAIYSDTSNESESVIIGYINKNQIAGMGETRFYSLDSSGNEKAYLWLKNTGKLELNGNDYSSVRYEPLNTELQSKINLLNTELTKIQTAIGSLGGVYVPSPLSLDLTNSKSEDVQLK